MLSLLAALHTLAAKRGEGLHPELIGALKHFKARSEVDWILRPQRVMRLAARLRLSLISRRPTPTRCPRPRC